MDRILFTFRRKLIETNRVRLAVAHELPTQLHRPVDYLRMVIADVAVQRDRAAYSITRQHVEEAPDADAIAIVAQRPTSHVGNLRLRCRDALVVHAKAGDHRDERTR